MTRDEFFLLNTQKQQISDALHTLKQVLTNDRQLAAHILAAEQALRLSQVYIVAQMATHKD